jgi:hypothetical protein
VDSVHSSTSSFKPLPQAWRSLAIGVALAAIWLASYEVLWRTRGFEPTLNDNEALWCRARAKVAPDGVAIIGSSRLQTGLDPTIMSHELGGRAVAQLALAGANPIPVLLELANDSTFHGLVVLEYMPRRLLTADSWSTNRANGFLAECRNPSLVSGFEASMGRVLQRRFVFLLPELQPISIVSYVARKRALPGGRHQELRDDRFNPAHFAKTLQSPTTAAGAIEATEFWEAPLDDAQLTARTTQLRDAIAKIRRRGGEVILYRSPVNGAVLAEEEARFPRMTWLPRLASMLGVRAIDFADLPGLRDVSCPDGEHPSADDVRRITETVSAELAR